MDYYKLLNIFHEYRYMRHIYIFKLSCKSSFVLQRIRLKKTIEKDFLVQIISNMQFQKTSTKTSWTKYFYY